MPGKRKKNKKNNNKKPKSQKINIFEVDLTPEEIENLKNGTEEELAEEVEDNPDFISKVKEFEKNHNNIKLIDVHSLIGNPVFKPYSELKPNALKKEYGKIIALLDKFGIIVHFNNDYTIEERYRFITQEIFLQYVEKSREKYSKITFIYEDFHPELDEEEELGF